MDTRYSRLKELRVHNSMTQKDFGKILGIKTNMYQKYEYGLMELPVKHAKTLGKYFNFDWWMLYED